MIKKGILQGWGKVVNSLFLDDYKINGSNHYDKLETTETTATGAIGVGCTV